MYKMQETTVGNESIMRVWCENLNIERSEENAVESVSKDFLLCLPKQRKYAVDIYDS